MSMNPAIGRSLQAGGHRTNYHESGRGKPLILLHGSGPGVSAWTNWSRVIPQLSTDFRVIAPDIAGFGFTEFKQDHAYTIKVWVAHLTGILDALGIERATLVGNSFGGGLSMAAALSIPERIEKLVLLGTPAGEFQMTEGLRSGWYYEPGLDAMERILRLFPHDQSFVTPEMVQERYEASARPGAQEAFRKLIPKPPPDGEPAVVKGVPESALATIRHPTLVLHGREDRVIPLDLGIRIHRSIPNSQLHAFGGCGHWVQLEREADFVRLVGDFAGRD